MNAAEIDSLFTSPLSIDPTYLHIRQSEHCAGDRAYIDDLWRRFRKYADPHFVDQFPRDFLARVWEMTLACMLEDEGYGIQSSKSGHGPDLQIAVADKPVFIEAIAAGVGEGKNEVPRPVSGQGMAFPSNQIMLRYATAATTKRTQFLGYLDRKKVSVEASKIIAIAGAKIADSDIEWPGGPPLVVRMLFGIGQRYDRFELGTGKLTAGGYHPMPTIKNANGVEVPVGMFTNSSFEEISGIFFAPHHVKNRPEVRGHARSSHDFIFVHNPMAANPLPIGCFKFGREFWPNRETQSLEQTDWRKPRQATLGTESGGT